MPDFSWSRAMTANQADDRPLAQWKYRRLPFPAQVTIFQRATTGNVRQTIDTGAQNIVQKSPVNAGGTAGQQPTVFNTIPNSFVADAGDELIISNDEVGGAVATVDGYINVEPL